MLLEEDPNLFHPESNWYSCFLTLEEIHESLISIYISSSLNIKWFGEIKTQVQSIIAYMEENIITQ